MSARLPSIVPCYKEFYQEKNGTLYSHGIRVQVGEFVRSSDFDPINKLSKGIWFSITPQACRGSSKVLPSNPDKLVIVRVEVPKEDMDRVTLQDDGQYLSPTLKIMHIHDPSDDGILALLAAALRSNVNPEIDNFMLLKSCEGNPQLVRQLLLDDRIDPCTNDGFVISFASRHNLDDLVLDFYTYARVPLNSKSNLALRTAATNGREDIVNWLLADPEVDPSDVDNEAICRAAENGHLQVVKRLLSDPRVNPGAQRNVGLRRAAEYGHWKVVKEILNCGHPEVNASACMNYALCRAVTNNHYKVVAELLKVSSVDPTYPENKPVRLACQTGNVRVLRMLLDDPRIGNSCKDNHAFQVAASRGHHHIIYELLMCTEKPDPTADDNFAIRFAVMHGHADTVALLLTLPSVSTSDLDQCIHMAIQKKHLGVAMLLAKDTDMLAHKLELFFSHSEYLLPGVDNFYD